MKAVTIARRFNHATFQYCPTSKSFLKVRGPEAPKFLNGLVTAKLIPNFIKKNLTTINPEQDEQVGLDFDESHSNWGLYNEMSFNGSYISRFGTYTGILNSKGRLLTDTILYPSPLCDGSEKRMAWPEYLLEFDKSIGPIIAQLVDMHVLTSKVKTKMYSDGLTSWDVRVTLPGVPRDVENPWIGNLLEPSTLTKTPDDALRFAAGVASALFQGNESRIIGMYIERRTDQLMEEDGSMGQQFRVVTKGTEDIANLLNPQGFPVEFKRERKDPTFFRRLRFEQGYVDSVRDYKPESLLPLELNFDFLPNAVSADKGCYVGQELTARTFATGILRKRLVPVTLTNLESFPLPQDKEYPDISIEPAKGEIQLDRSTAPSPFGSSTSSRARRQRPAGSLIANEGDRGVALIRIEHFKRAFHGDDDDHPFYISTGQNNEGKIGVIPRQPFWLQDHEDKEDEV
ncbi:IBA57 (YJR122W) [Zygosaccharomyces parabailii]|nr:IBA57 (YJR122W) [Zygosaccharomyces parabailii]CDH09253.1 related to Putative transferase CAF17,mitochondrial [Zygosaccharomyces bailii ISA1307]